MRTRFTASLIAVSMLAATAAAAPTSMLRCMPAETVAPTPPARVANARVASPPKTATTARASTSAIAAANAAESRGQVEMARRLLHDHLSANPYDVRGLRELGQLEDRQGRLTEAELRYRQAVGADGSSSAAVNDLALCLARQGKLRESEAAFRRAIAMRPDKPLYRNNLATVLVRLGDVDGALDEMRVVYEPATAAFNVGQLLAREGRKADAALRFREALAYQPTFQPAIAALSAVAPPAVTPNPTIAAAPNSAPPVTPVATPAVVAPAAPPTVAAVPARPTATPYVAAVPGYAPQPTSAAPTYTAPANQTAPQPAPAPTFPRLLPPVIER